MFITTALIGKFLLGGAVVAGAATVAYVAVKEYEKSVKGKAVMNQNALFCELYSNEQYNKVFRQSSFHDKISELKGLKEGNILSEQEFNEIAAEIVKAK